MLVYSGDTRFYSGASSMMEKLENLGVRARVLPAFQYPAAGGGAGAVVAGWNLVSAHGRTCDPVAESACAGQTHLLPHRRQRARHPLPPSWRRGLRGRAQAVGASASARWKRKIFPRQRQRAGRRRPATLSVLLVEAAEVLPRAPGLPDRAFRRGDVPMTKQEVRAAVLAKLAVRPEDILWDVGAGTGSVSVELALAAPGGRVYAVECRPEGCALIKANREKFRTRNLVLVEGLAPAALSERRTLFHRRSKGLSDLDKTRAGRPSPPAAVAALKGKKADRAGEPDRRQPGHPWTLHALDKNPYAITGE